MDRDDSSFECDGCWSLYHTKCAAVRKTDLTARKGSKCLKLFCVKCFVDPGRALTEKVETMLKYVYKIDMKLQKNEEYFKNVEVSIAQCREENTVANNNNAERLENMKFQINEFGVKLQECSSVVSNANVHKHVLSTNTVGDKRLYADVVGTSTKALIIQPKKKEQNSSTTKEMLQRVVNATEVGVSGVKSLSNGAVLIQCKTDEGIDAIEQKVKEHDNENYTTKEKSNTNNGKMKIVGMTKKYDEQELSGFITSQLDVYECDTIKVLKIYTDKNLRNERYNAIVELNSAVMNELIKKGKINVNWDECRVHAYIQIKRCFKCLGFNHMANECKNKLACSKCGDEHRATECNSETTSCVNCVEFNKRNNENIEASHHAFSL